MKKVDNVDFRSNEMEDMEGGNGLYFAFSSLVKGKEKQIMSFHSCREGLTKEIYDFFDPSCVCGPKEINTDNTRILVFSKNSNGTKYLDEWMETGLKILNHHEDLVGWSKTKLFRIKHNICNDASIYLFVGDIKWMMSVHMISLFTLLIRVGVQTELRKFETHKEFLKACYRMCHKEEKYAKVSHFSFGAVGADIKRFGSVYGKIRIIMRNFDYLFGGKTIEECYKQLSNKKAYGEGINILCEDRSAAGDNIIGERFSKLCKKYDI